MHIHGNHIIMMFLNVLYYYAALFCKITGNYPNDGTAAVSLVLSAAPSVLHLALFFGFWWQVFSYRCHSGEAAVTGINGVHFAGAVNLFLPQKASRVTSSFK